LNKVVGSLIADGGSGAGRIEVGLSNGVSRSPNVGLPIKEKN